MHQFTGKVILILILIAFFLGALVAARWPNYTLEHNIRSNRSYYPSVKVGVPDEAEDPQEETGAQGY